MSRNIAAGCLVMVYGLVRDVENNGKCGTVKFWVEPEERFRSMDGTTGYSRRSGWLVAIESIPHGCGVFQPKNLIRIDNYDDSAETTTKDWELTV